MVRLVNDERMKAGRINIFWKNRRQRGYPARQITGDNYQDFVHWGEGGGRVMDLSLFSCWRLVVEWKSFASSVRPLLEFHGNLANGRGTLYEPFLRVLRWAHIWSWFFLFFSPYRRRAIFWEVGVPLSGFRSIVFRSACFASPVAENAPTDVALARAACRHRTGLSLPVPVAHATYIQMPAPAVVRGVFYTSYTRERYFRVGNTRGNSFRLIPRQWLNLESRIHSRKMYLYLTLKKDIKSVPLFSYITFEI